MCGRFALSTPIETIAASIDLQLSQEVMDFNPNWNIAPSSSAPIVVQSKADASTAQGRTLRTMRWGFRPSWAKPSTREPINARSETVLHKPMFRSAFMERRAVVPANGWYEWMTTPQGKVPWYHQRSDGELALFAAVWERWQDESRTLHSFALLTQEANEDCSEVHNRMPVLISANDMEGWFDEGMLPPPTPKGTITRYPVSRDINRPGINHPGLVEPLRTLFDQEYGV